MTPCAWIRVSTFGLVCYRSAGAPCPHCGNGTTWCRCRWLVRPCTADTVYRSDAGHRCVNSELITAWNVSINQPGFLYWRSRDYRYVDCRKLSNFQEGWFYMTCCTVVVIEACHVGRIRMNMILLVK